MENGTHGNFPHDLIAHFLHQTQIRTGRSYLIRNEISDASGERRYSIVRIRGNVTVYDRLTVRQLVAALTTELFDLVTMPRVDGLA